MRKRRRQFTPQYKFESVLEVLRGEKSAAQICRERQLSEDLLSRWKQEFMKRAPEIFETRKGGNGPLPKPVRRKPFDKGRIDELERVVKHLLVEVNVLKGITGT